MTPFDGVIEAGIWVLLAALAFSAGVVLAREATGVPNDLSRAPIAKDPRRDLAPRR
jgi:hypothetical protein